MFEAAWHLKDIHNIFRTLLCILYVDKVSACSAALHFLLQHSISVFPERIIEGATVPGKWLRPNHVRCIRRPTGDALSTRDIFDLSVQYPVLYHHIESRPYPRADLMCHEWFKIFCNRKRSASQSRGYIPRPTGSVLSTKKYWTHRSTIQYYTITLNDALTQGQVWYAMHDSKSYCTRKMSTTQSHRVHSKTHRICPMLTRNIGHIGLISSTIPSHWIQPLPKGSSDMLWMIQRATVPEKLLRPNHEQYISRPTGSVLSTQEISVQYPIIYLHIESCPCPKAGLICREWFK